MMDKSEFAIATSQTYRAFQIDKPYRHNQNLVGTLHGTSLLWSTIISFIFLLNYYSTYCLKQLLYLLLSLQISP